MSFKHEESDGLIPNKQTPPATKQLGTSADPWDELNATTVTATTVSGSTVGAGSDMFVGGARVPQVKEVIGDLASSGAVYTHNLGTQYVVFQVYDGNGSGVPFGSGQDTGPSGLIVNSTAAIDTNRFAVFPNGAITAARVVFIG